MDNIPGEGKAIPFIVNQNGEFSVSEVAKEYLRSLDGKKVGIVCVVGKYRTGKSFFINKVILDRQTETGFNVGPTVNPCTKVCALNFRLNKNRVNNHRAYGYGIKPSKK
jgi:Guanylate-binding protein, N-terminal domain